MWAIDLGAVLLDWAGFEPEQGRPLVEQCRNLKIPVVAVIAPEALGDYDPSLNPDDFILRPIHQHRVGHRVFNSRQCFRSGRHFRSNFQACSFKHQSQSHTNDFMIIHDQQFFCSHSCSFLNR